MVVIAAVCGSTVHANIHSRIFLAPSKMDRIKFNQIEKSEPSHRDNNSRYRRIEHNSATLQRQIRSSCSDRHLFHVRRSGLYGVLFVKLFRFGPTIRGAAYRYVQYDWVHSRNRFQYDYRVHHIECKEFFYLGHPQYSTPL